MKLIGINTVKNVACKTYLHLQKISPELALGGSIICGVGALVAVALVSDKLNTAIKDTHEELDRIQKHSEVSGENDETKISNENIKKMSWRAYNKLIWKIAKILAPAIGLEVASIVLMLLSHGILKKRYLDTSAALTALTEAFTAYRGRVKDAVGEDVEKIIMSGGKINDGIKIEDENGNVVEVPGNHIVVDEHKNSPYEFDFNRHTAPLTWSPNPDYSEAFLRNTQNYFNDIFNTRGHVFLNEVLDELGLQRTPAGALTGWIKGAGDDYIDFGYFESFMRDRKLDSDLCRKNIHLNFNVDGVIYDLI